MSLGQTEDDGTYETLEEILSETDNDRVSYHLRSAMQLMEAEDEL